MTMPARIYYCLRCLRASPPCDEDCHCSYCGGSGFVDGPVPGAISDLQLARLQEAGAPLPED